jgi:hypothetical protein
MLTLLDTALSISGGLGCCHPKMPIGGKTLVSALSVPRTRLVL